MLDVHTMNLLERLVIAMEDMNKTLKNIEDKLDDIDGRLDGIEAELKEMNDIKVI